jgi:hypothetical protein
MGDGLVRAAFFEWPKCHNGNAFSLSQKKVNLFRKIFGRITIWVFSSETHLVTLVESLKKQSASYLA